MTSMTSVEAQNRFGQLLDTVQHEPVSITRDGRPAAFIVSPQDMEELLELRARRGQAAAAFSDWTEEARQRLTPAAAELTDDEINRMVHELR
jgi:prevent-host-death family protein